MARAKLSAVIPSAMLLTLIACTREDDVPPDSGIYEMGHFNCDEVNSDLLNDLFEVNDEWYLVGEDNEEQPETDDDIDDDFDENQSNSESCWYASSEQIYRLSVSIDMQYAPDVEFSQRAIENRTSDEIPTSKREFEELADHGYGWERVGTNNIDKEEYKAIFLDSNLILRASIHTLEFDLGSLENSEIDILLEIADHVYKDE